MRKNKETSTQGEQRPGMTLVVQLIALVGVLMIIPLFEKHTAERAAQIVALSVLFVTGILINRRYPRVRLTNILVVLLLPMTWATLFFDQRWLFVTSCGLSGVFFLITAVVVMWEVFRWYSATFHSVFGAVSAYLLLGLAWSMFYWGLDAWDATAFDIPHRRSISIVAGETPLTAFSQMIYFSFVCLTSVGFGDITPASAIAETLAWLESVVGVFFLAVLVARLVASIPTTDAGTQVD